MESIWILSGPIWWANSLSPRPKLHRSLQGRFSVRAHSFEELSIKASMARVSLRSKLSQWLLDVFLQKQAISHDSSPKWWIASSTRIKIRRILLLNKLSRPRKTYPSLQKKRGTKPRKMWWLWDLKQKPYTLILPPSAVLSNNRSCSNRRSMRSTHFKKKSAF